MNPRGFALFDTAIGACGVAWSERGVVGVQLPEKSRAAARSRLARRFPGAEEAAPPPKVARAIAAITALLRGEARNLAEIELDLGDVGGFEARVYDVARTIAPGETLNYGEIAARLGQADAARAVGQAMGRNPFPIVVPCHRVLGADGKLGGFSAHGGVETKLKLLAIEGARIGDAPTLFADLPIAIAPKARA